MSAINTYAIVENGIVINTTVWDGGSDWAPPEGAEAIVVPEGDAVGVGCTYDGTSFSEPPAVATL